MSGLWRLERNAKRSTTHGFVRELGEPPYEYAWGRINSEFDAKGCVSEIIITYAD